jgi:hypothetical protein
MFLRTWSWLNSVKCTVHVITLAVQTGFSYVVTNIAVVNGSVVFHLHHMVIIQQRLGHWYPLVSLRSHIYMGFMSEGWLHHNICVPCPVQWNLMCPLNAEISCNDILFNFNYIMVLCTEYLLNQCVQWNSLKTFLVKQFSHQLHPQEKSPEFHQILLECCIYDIGTL